MSTQGVEAVGVDSRIRDLCRKILAEPDPKKVEALLATLQEIMKDEQDDARLRMSYIAKHFRNLIEHPQQDEPAAPGGNVINFPLRSMLEFLGLVRDERPEEKAS
jgi:hypothetical protein